MDIREIRQHSNLPPKRHPWELARVEVLLDIFRKNNPDPANSVILDIGCGDTFFAEKISEHFPSVTFIAIDTAFKEETIRNYENELKEKNIKLFDSLAKAKDAIGPEVSAIFLFDVIEHIEDDLGFLNELARQPFLSDQTQLFITVPAFQSLFTSHDVFLGHFKRYTNSTLINLINKSGFKESEIGYFFFSLLLARILQFLKEKIIGPPKKPTTDVAEWEAGALTTSIIKSILVLDYKLTSLLKKTGVNIVGLSNYVVCKKSV